MGYMEYIFDPNVQFIILEDIHRIVMIAVMS
jgi:hypothetical protein